MTKKKNDSNVKVEADPKLPRKTSWNKKPGAKADTSGQYERIGPRGGRTGKKVTVVEGEPLPPTKRPGETYRIVDKTKHKSKK